MGLTTFPVNDPFQHYDRLRAEGRQVNFSVRGLNQSGQINTPFSQSSLGSFTVPPGRRYIPTACTVSSSVPARALILISEEQLSFFGIGAADENDASSASSAVTIYVDLPNGGSESVNLAMEMPEGTSVAFRIQPYYGTVRAAGSMNVTALDVTNDNNYDAQFIHLVAGDSLSHSLPGDWLEPMDAPSLAGYTPQSNAVLRPPFGGDALWAFKTTKWLNEQGASFRLVNKGFGGSDMLQKQYAQLLRGYYDGIAFDLLTVTIGANDSTENWNNLVSGTTQTRRQVFPERLEKFVKLRDRLRPGKPINFITPWLLDDALSRSSVDQTRNYIDPGETKTRLMICRDLIIEQMGGREAENIYVIDGFLADYAPYNSTAQEGLKLATFNNVTGVLTTTPGVTDDIYFKYNSANPTNIPNLPGANEQYTGLRVHRSAQGHENCKNLIIDKWQDQAWYQSLL